MRAGRSDCASCARSSTSSRATGTSARERRAPREDRGSVGILGGTFDPPHLGHLAIARHALRELSLRRCWLMPARMPPHKSLEREPTAAQRLEMCRLLVASEERVSVCELELERDGPSYTVDTLSELHARDPHTELTFIVGADTAATLPAWREPQMVLDLAELAVAARSGTDRRKVLDAIAAVGTAEPRVRFLKTPLIDASSSLVRERAAAQEPLQGLVGADVAGYIVEHGLYGAGAREASR